MVHKGLVIVGLVSAVAVSAGVYYASKKGIFPPSNTGFNFNLNLENNKVRDQLDDVILLVQLVGKANASYEIFVDWGDPDVSQHFFSTDGDGVGRITVNHRYDIGTSTVRPFTIKVNAKESGRSSFKTQSVSLSVLPASEPQQPPPDDPNLPSPPDVEMKTCSCSCGEDVQVPVGQPCPDCNCPPPPPVSTDIISGFHQSKSSGQKPLEVHFDFSVNRELKQASIIFGDGQSFVFGPNLSVDHTYQNKGTFNGKLQVEALNGSKDEIAFSVIVNETISVPQGEIVVTTKSGPKYTFFANFGGSGNSYEWEFGDGGKANFSNQQTISHEYQSAGNYTVKCNVRNSSGTGSDTVAISIGDHEVEVRFGDVSLRSASLRDDGNHHIRADYSIRNDHQHSNFTGRARWAITFIAPDGKRIFVKTYTLDKFLQAGGFATFSKSMDVFSSGKYEVSFTLQNTLNSIYVILGDKRIITIT